MQTIEKVVDVNLSMPFMYCNCILTLLALCCHFNQHQQSLDWNLLAKSFYSSVDVLRIKQILILQNLLHVVWS